MLIFQHAVLVSSSFRRISNLFCDRDALTVLLFTPNGAEVTRPVDEEHATKSRARAARAKGQYCSIEICCRSFAAMEFGLNRYRLLTQAAKCWRDFVAFSRETAAACSPRCKPWVVDVS